MKKKSFRINFIYNNLFFSSVSNISSVGIFVLVYFYIIFYWGFVGSSRADFEDFYNCVFVVLLDNNIGNYVLLRIFVQKIFEKNE